MIDAYSMVFVVDDDTLWTQDSDPALPSVSVLHSTRSP
jgi:hypothetical protein